MRALSAAAVAFMTLTGSAQAETKSLTLATGSELGTYYPVGVALRMLLEQTPAAGKLALKAVPTKGSIDNLEGMRSGAFDLALVQNDQLKDAVQGTGAFAGKPIANLRSVMRLHEEALALVVRRSAKIRSLDDLSGHKIDLGAVGSAGRLIAEHLLAATAKPGPLVVDLQNIAVSSALCQKRIDGAFLFIGHPSAVLVDALGRCKGRLVPLHGPAVDSVLKDNNGLSPAAIPARGYAGVNKPVPTIGSYAVLVARADLDDAAVHDLLAAASDNFNLLLMLHPALFGIENPAALRPDGGAVPLHAEAARFFDSKTTAK